ncbi:fibroblast growth factor receptor-like 1 [Xenopus laevis]|uniref:Fibroblast growth factor receptor-like 1 n=1 Tax=Xenopus laevis TaxID=8355 RepID=A0A8J1LYN4_XENLA|nr:fibroblast growth factor receptor-like 1 [Xenopus laevis]
MRHLLRSPLLILVVFVVVTAAQKPTDPTQLHLDKSHHEEARVGTNVTLWCNFTTKSAAQLGPLTVHWTKDGHTVFFLNKTYTYPNNTSISEAKLQKGDASLSLSNISREDAGIYTCSIQHGTNRGSQNVTLRILGDGDPMGQKGDGPSTKHRTLKIGMVTGVLVGAWCVAFLIFFCYKP